MKPYNVSDEQWKQYNMLFFMEHFLGRSNFEKLFKQKEKKLLDDIDHYATAYTEENPFKVIEYQKGEWKEPYDHPYYPKIFRGAALDWPCCTKWSFDYFAEQFGEKEVNLISNVGIRGHNSATMETVKLKNYISELKAGSLKYLKFNQMIKEYSELQNDFDGEFLKKFQKSGEFKKHYFLFMGAKGTMTPIHNGIQPTVFVQISGQKKWVFYPSGDRLFLGVRPERRSYFYSTADTNNTSDPKFPLLKHATPHEVILNEGDVMWFPSFVWHQVQNVTDSIGVAYKFFYLPSSWFSSKMMTTLFFLSTKPWLLESVLLSKINKSVYMFDSPDR